MTTDMAWCPVSNMAVIKRNKVTNGMAWIPVKDSQDCFFIFIYLFYFFVMRKFYTQKTHITEQKQKQKRFYALKKHLREKSCLFAYLRFVFLMFFVLLCFCVFYVFCAFCAYKFFCKRI